MIRAASRALSIALSGRVPALVEQQLPAAGLLLGSAPPEAAAAAAWRQSGAPRCYSAQPAHSQEQDGDDITEEFRESVRTFAQEYIAPHATEIDRLNGYPPGFDFWRQAGDFGLHGEHGARRMRNSALPRH